MCVVHMWASPSVEWHRANECKLDGLNSMRLMELRTQIPNSFGPFGHTMASNEIEASEIKCVRPKRSKLKQVLFKTGNKFTSKEVRDSTSVPLVNKSFDP